MENGEWRNLAAYDFVVIIDTKQLKMIRPKEENKNTRVKASNLNFLLLDPLSRHEWSSLCSAQKKG